MTELNYKLKVLLFIYVVSLCVDFIISPFGYILRRIYRVYATHNCIIFLCHCKVENSVQYLPPDGFFCIQTVQNSISDGELTTLPQTP